jgi:hypothetical protein
MYIYINKKIKIMKNLSNVSKWLILGVIVLDILIVMGGMYLYNNVSIVIR